mmetsp:Transcript_15330/g.31235  ORF Transcript_15330/g.31235 Transcript_15330/m.31235 type:complete len:222 (-) Transcript_15330:1145-1810(-)
MESVQYCPHSPRDRRVLASRHLRPALLCRPPGALRTGPDGYFYLDLRERLGLQNEEPLQQRQRARRRPQRRVRHLQNEGCHGRRLGPIARQAQEEEQRVRRAQTEEEEARPLALGPHELRIAPNSLLLALVLQDGGLHVRGLRVWRQEHTRHSGLLHPHCDPGNPFLHPRHRWDSLSRSQVELSPSLRGRRDSRHEPGRWLDARRARRSHAVGQHRLRDFF